MLQLLLPPPPASDAGVTDSAGEGAALGDVVWRVLVRMLRPSFLAPWRPAAAELFKSLRHVAVATSRLPELVEASIRLLADLRERHLVLGDAGLAARRVVLRRAVALLARPPPRPPPPMACRATARARRRRRTIP